MPKSRGFTLIELLVSISIIAVLAAIGLVAYSAVMKQGRDSKRQSDLRSIQSALEQYNSDQGSYPASMPTSGSLTNCTGITPPCKVSRTYLNAIPQDPNTTPSYKYVVSGSNYCLYTYLENLSSPQLGSCPVNGSYNFALTPP